MAEIPPTDFLSKIEADLTEHGQSIRAAHARISKCIRTRDLAGLMTHNQSDPHGILTLAPDQLAPCAGIIREFGEAAAAVTDEIKTFGPHSTKEVETLLESSTQDTYELLQEYLQRACNAEISAVEETKAALEKIEGKSYTQALLLKYPEEEVMEMYDEKPWRYEEMRKELHEEHHHQIEEAATQLVIQSTLPPLHGKVHAKRQLVEALQQKADFVTSKRRFGETLHAGLQQQQAEVHEKKQKCNGIRRVTIREEKAKRVAVVEAMATLSKAMREHRDAYLQNEAAALMEAGAQTGDYCGNANWKLDMKCQERGIMVVSQILSKAQRCQANLGCFWHLIFSAF